ncbi:MAG: ArsR family transcriptional regulator [Plesiomonas sp.]|uniref:ArsR family transcriptional regulator n=1 Tax=Plesiomonas sp. TaxID=2486279 RepID=UPI003F2D5DA4
MSNICKTKCEIIKNEAIKQGSFFIKELSIATKLSSSTVVHHLKKIEANGELSIRVDRKRHGTNYLSYYTVRDKTNADHRQPKSLWRIALFGARA